MVPKADQFIDREPEPLLPGLDSTEFVNRISVDVLVVGRLVDRANDPIEFDTRTSKPSGETKESVESI